MDKDKWLSEKIAKLIDEGKPRDEAVAQAEQMWRDKYEKAMHADDEDTEPAPDPDADTEDAEDDAPMTDEDPKEKALFQRVWDRIQSALGTKAEDDGTGFKVVGQHWIATWTNAYKDRDEQFFPEAEIKAYIQRVAIGIAPLPELWIWHGGKQTRVGVAEQVDGHGRFGIAAGKFDDTPRGQKARAFYAVAKNAKDTRLSHGFTYPVKEFDGTHFKRFNTFEISLLPKGVEANLYTSLEGVKAMKIDEQKRKYYEKVFGKEDFDNILAGLDEKDAALTELGAAHKDFTDTDQKASASDDDLELVTALKELLPEIVGGQAEVVQAAAESMKAVKALATQVAELQAYVKAQKALTPKRASTAPETELDVDDEDDKEFLERFEKGEIDEKLVKALGASAFDQSDFRKSLSQHGLNLR